jgi:hypothetical protein
MTRANLGNMGLPELPSPGGTNLDARARQHRPADRHLLRCAAAELCAPRGAA